MSEQKKQNFLQGTALLAMATVIVKLVGALYKVPLNAIIGEKGFGYFSTAYEIYNILLMISTAGLPVAMSRMISEAWSTTPRCGRCMPPPSGFSCCWALWAAS